MRRSANSFRGVTSRNNLREDSGENGAILMLPGAKVGRFITLRASNVVGYLSSLDTTVTSILQKDLLAVLK